MDNVDFFLVGRSCLHDFFILFGHFTHHHPALGALVLISLFRNPPVQTIKNEQVTK